MTRLVIRHYRLQSNHWFVASRLRFTLEELKAAKVEESQTFPVTTEQENGKTYKRPYQLFTQNREGMSHEHAYPYPLLDEETEGAPAMLESLTKAGNKGHSTTFDRIAYGYLADRHGRETPLRRDNPLARRERQLRNMGIDPEKPTTLGEMYDKALAHEKRLERRHAGPLEKLRQWLGI